MFDRDVCESRMGDAVLVCKLFHSPNLNLAVRKHGSTFNSTNLNTCACAVFRCAKNLSSAPYPSHLFLCCLQSDTYALEPQLDMPAGFGPGFDEDGVEGLIVVSTLQALGSMMSRYLNP